MVAVLTEPSALDLFDLVGILGLFFLGRFKTGIWVGSTALVRGPVGLVAYPRSAILARWVP